MPRRKSTHGYAVTSVEFPDPPWKVYHEDCLVGVPKRVKQGLPTLLCADAPYNIGQPYSDYHDRKTQLEYLAWYKERLAVAVEHLHPHASIWLAINDTNVSELDILCKRELGLFPRSKVIWYFSFGQNHAGSLTPSHVTWLTYSRHRTQFTFNADAVRVPSARQLLYNDKRANPRGRLPDDVWVLLPAHEPSAFKPLDDTWCFSRICGTFKAKIKDSPNQLPVPMLDRIVRLCSNPGDTVLDIFAGTGTAGVAAVAAGRRFIGFDVSKACVAACEKALASVTTASQPGKDSPCKAPTRKTRPSSKK